FDRFTAVKQQIVSGRRRQPRGLLLRHRTRNARDRAVLTLGGGAAVHMDVHRPQPALLRSGTWHCNLLQLNADTRSYIADRQHSVKQLTSPPAIRPSVTRPRPISGRLSRSLLGEGSARSDGSSPCRPTWSKLALIAKQKRYCTIPASCAESGGKDDISEHGSI